MRTVLIVDDSVDTAEMYALGLLHAGYRPLTASNVESAQCSVKLDRPNAIVTDLNLPDCGGWALIEGLKADPLTRDIPVVVLTGRSDPALVPAARRAGCAAVLLKPCLPDELAHVLSSIIDPAEGRLQI